MQAATSEGIRNANNNNNLPPLLPYPDFNQSLILDADASTKFLGARLY